MWSNFCGFLLRAMGWTSDNGPCPEKKAIILGVPHTSFWDFVISYLYYNQFKGEHPKVMIKKELFIGPLGWILKRLGGIPTDRSNATALIKSIVTAMEKEDKFILALAPEGTRKPIRKWKTGYHVIAKAVNCPVYLGYFNWKTKHVGRGEKIELTNDARADTERIQSIYEKMNLEGKNKNCFLTH